jgi:hypothetical protein
VPFAGDGRPHPLTVSALEAQAPGRVEYVDVSGSPYAYWELMRALWTAGEDFALVEHDVVVADGTIDAFERCPAGWCCAPSEYDYWALPPLPATPPDTFTVGAVPYYGLRVHRWRREAMLAYPTLLDEVGERVVRGFEHKPGGYWEMLDGRMLRPLQERVAGPHVHGECPALHLHHRRPKPARHAVVARRRHTFPPAGSRAARIMEARERADQIADW